MWLNSFEKVVLFLLFTIFIVKHNKVFDVDGDYFKLKTKIGDKRAQTFSYNMAKVRGPNVQHEDYHC